MQKSITKNKVFNARRVLAAIGIIAFSTITVIIAKANHKGPMMPVPEYRITGAEGNSKPILEIYEYTDLACPACAIANISITDIIGLYGDKIKLHFKHFPLAMHKWSEKAALYADCAGEQGQFFPYARMLFENQEKWAESETEPKEFNIYADLLSLDKEKMQICLKNTSNQERIKLEKAEGKAKGIEGTPAFFINGKFRMGAGAVIEEAKKIENKLLQEKRK